MGPIKAVATGYSRMFNFTGRAPRGAYWWFFVWQILVGAVVGGWFGGTTAVRAQSDPAFAAMLKDPVAAEAYFNNLFAGYELPLIAAYVLLFVIPNLSLTIRRLHDTDRSGWNIFMPTVVAIGSGIAGIMLMTGSAATGSQSGVMLAMVVMVVPGAIASIWFLVWMCLPGTHGDNRFGGDPITNRKAKVPAHPAFAKEIQGEERDRAEVARRAAASDYYKRRVLPSIQKA